VAVRDTGIGIAPEDLPNLFTKFYQGANASGARIEGSGLGLALVKALVQGHGGSVSVDSTPGAGSTFTVELPLTDAGKEPARIIPEVAGKQSSVHG
jgi:two-component system sensor histidine kinase BaeS